MGTGWLYMERIMNGIRMVDGILVILMNVLACSLEMIFMSLICLSRRLSRLVT